MNASRATRSLKGFPDSEPISNEELIALQGRRLIPAAIDGVVHARTSEGEREDHRRGRQRPDHSRGTQDSRRAGVFIIPDVLCNAGGVIVSYFEWVQGLQNFFWSEREVNEKLKDSMVNAFQRVATCMDKYKTRDMKTAALITGVERLNRAMLLRGLFP